MHETLYLIPITEKTKRTIEKDIPYKLKTNSKKVVILISNKADFRPRKITRDKERIYYDKRVNSLRHQSLCRLFLQLTFTTCIGRSETEKSTVILGIFSIPLSLIDRKN
jgi:hypothetical protein